MSAHSAALFDRVFAVVMAFFLPGLILLFGLATASAPVQAWFTGAQGNPTLAGLVFVMMAALALNLSITCVRWLLFEALPCWPRRAAGAGGPTWRLQPLVPAAPPFDESNRVAMRDALREITHDFYYHYLAYANTAVALPAAVLIWLVGTPMRPGLALAVLIGTALVTTALSAAACDAIGRYDRSAAQVLGVHPDAPAEGIAPAPPTASTAGVVVVAPTAVPPAAAGAVQAP